MKLLSPGLKFKVEGLPETKFSGNKSQKELNKCRFVVFPGRMPAIQSNFNLARKPFMIKSLLIP
jgi:hypothetical protein